MSREEGKLDGTRVSLDYEMRCEARIRMSIKEKIKIIENVYSFQPLNMKETGIRELLSGLGDQVSYVSMLSNK